MALQDSTILPIPSLRKRATFRRWNIEGLSAVAIGLVAWQFASTKFPPYLFPPLQDIASTFWKLLLDGSLLHSTGLTYLRIITALAISFTVSTAIGIGAALNTTVDRVVLPYIQFKQGVPSICWIIFSILWFKEVEIRIAFIVIISTLPSFFYLTRDGVRAIPLDLWQMVRAWRPSFRQLMQKLVIPAVLPTMVTGLRINIGTAARVAIFAELLGGISGVGYHLRVAEEQFRMDVVMSWTIVLVILILVLDKLMQRLETRLTASQGRLGVQQ